MLYSRRKGALPSSMRTTRYEAGCGHVGRLDEAADGDETRYAQRVFRLIIYASAVIGLHAYKKPVSSWLGVNRVGGQCDKRIGLLI